nr:MAG TPA: hypothetical protein [Caudoviricetes sp.]
MIGLLGIYDVYWDTNPKEHLGTLVPRCSQALILGC